MSGEKIKQFVRCVKRLPLNFNHQAAEFTYDNSVLILVDATLSINRNYKKFVVPRIELVERSGLATLSDLKERLKQEGESGFCLFWDYNDSARVRLLERLADKFLEIKKSFGTESDLQAFRKWGEVTVADDYDKFKVTGIGFITFQYLRILCGADTVKPDVHITKAVRECLGEGLSLTGRVKLIEWTAKKLSVRAQRLDYALWDYYSRR